MDDSQTSSEDDIEQSNIFQKARRVRAPNQLNANKSSPAKSPAKSPARSPFRSPRSKTRKLNIVEERSVEIDWQVGPQLNVPRLVPPQEEQAHEEQEHEEQAHEEQARELAGEEAAHEIFDQDELVLSSVLSSEPLDPNEIESLVRDSIKTTETVPLSQFVQENCEFIDLDEEEETPQEFEVRAQNCSLIEKIEIEAVANALRKLRLKTAQESKAVQALAQVPVDKNSRPPLQASSQAEISRLKMVFALLRDLRMRMLQALNDAKHEQSQLEANERIYCQLYEQIEDAASLADHHKASAQKADKLAQSIEDQEAENDVVLTKLRQLEEDLGAQLSIMTKHVLKSTAAGATGGETFTSKAYNAQLDRLTKSLGVTASIENNVGIISTTFFSIRADLATDKLDYHFNYPSNISAIGDHYKQIILTERNSIRKSILLWNRALALSRVFVRLQKQCPMLDSNYDPELQVTKLRFYPQTTIELHGTSVIIESDADNEPLRELKTMKEMIV